MRGALNQKESAAYLGMCVNTFKSEVRPHVPRVDLGRKMLFSVQELDRWLDRRLRGL